MIPVLLHLLQSSKRSDDVTEDSATINIVMCLGMLTEERRKFKILKQLISVQV